MHHLILITAMSATTGLFGGGKPCGKPHHGRKAVAASGCYSARPCGTSYASPAPAPCGASPVPSYYSASPQAYPASMQGGPAAPAPTTSVPPAPMAPAPPAPSVPPAPSPSSPPVSGS